MDGRAVRWKLSGASPTFLPIFTRLGGTLQGFVPYLPGPSNNGSHNKLRRLASPRRRRPEKSAARKPSQTLAIHVQRSAMLQTHHAICAASFKVRRRSTRAIAGIQQSVSVHEIVGICRYRRPPSDRRDSAMNPYRKPAHCAGRNPLRLALHLQP